VVDDSEPGRPPVESVFVAFIATTFAGGACAQVLARMLPPPPGTPPPAVTLTMVVASVSLAFAVAQAVLPGPRSAGCAGLAIPIVGAMWLAVGGYEPATVVAALFSGVFLTPAAYYLAIRFSRPLGGVARRRPLAALVAGGLATLLLLQALRLVAHLSDPAIDWRLFR
jgi:hypothetical protein